MLRPVLALRCLLVVSALSGVVVPARASAAPADEVPEATLAASAGDSPGAPRAANGQGRGDADWSFDGYAGLNGGHVTGAPPVSSFRTPNSITDPGLASVTANNGSSYAGGLDLRVGIHGPGRFGVDVPLAGLRFDGLGVHHTTLRNTAGDVASLDLHLLSGTFSLGGLGAHAALGPVLLRAAIRPVLEWSTAYGTVTQGLIAADVSSIASCALGVDADVEACGMVAARLGVCALVSPRMWRTIGGEGGAANGVFFGVGVQFW